MLQGSPLPAQLLLGQAFLPPSRNVAASSMRRGQESESASYPFSAWEPLLPHCSVLAALLGGHAEIASQSAKVKRVVQEASEQQSWLATTDRAGRQALGVEKAVQRV